MMRDTVFIGHATPQDNEFAIWLYSKLELEGYKVWCDLEDLLGGERDFWQEIQKVLEVEAHKYLLVFSKHSFKKEGVIDEFEFARSVAKDCNLKDFVIPLKIDNVSYGDRIGVNRYNIINFSDSWIHGLRKLLKKLNKDETPKNTGKSIGISDRTLNIYHSDSKVLNNSKERYFSNWWPVPKLPEKVYIFQYRDENSARMIIEEDANYPVILHGAHLVSFEPNITEYSTKNGNLRIRYLERSSIKVSDVLNRNDSGRFPTLTDSENFLKRLLKKAFKNLMYEREFFKYDLSYTQCFYNRVKTEGGKIKNYRPVIKYWNRKKSKAIVGKYHDSYWHFAVSAQARLHPFVCLSLKSHILFSDDGFQIWSSDSKLHTARRTKGKTWFNEQWRDLLMAFISSIAGKKRKIRIRFSNDFVAYMPLLTEQMFSGVGYTEPDTKSRLKVLHERADEFDEFGDDQEN